MNRKDEIKVWMMGIVISLIVMFLSFDSVVAKIDALNPQLAKQITSTSVYKGYNSIKIKESSLWNLIKGQDQDEDQSQNNDELVSSNDDKTKVLGTSSVTPTVTVIPTPSNYDNSVIKPPFKVQIVGDSMVLEGFGPQMKIKLLEYQGVTVFSNGKYSTGLNRIDYYDWFAETSSLLASNKPDVLIVMFGANDGQGIVAKDGSIGALGSAKWKQIYIQRVLDYLTLVSPKVGLIYWVGQPIPRTSDFYNKFLVMNPIYQSECAQFTNCRFVNEWDRFAVNGKYAASVADDSGLVQTVKGPDGVHVTVHGGNIMADEVIKMMKKDIQGMTLKNSSN